MITLSKDDIDKLKYFITLVVSANYQLKQVRMDNSNISLAHEFIVDAYRQVIPIMNILNKGKNIDD